MAGSMPIVGHIGTGYSVLCRGYRFIQGEDLREQIQHDYDKVVEFFAGKTVIRRDGSADNAGDVTHG